MNVPTKNTRPHFVFQSPSTTERPSATTHSYTPAQINTDTNKTPTFNINTKQTNLPSNTKTSRTLSRPLIPIFLQTRTFYVYLKFQQIQILYQLTPHTLIIKQHIHLLSHEKQFQIQPIKILLLLFPTD